MDHDRPVGLVVSTDVRKIKSFGKVVINLYGAELPFSADHIPHHKVDLGSIERGFARLLSERDAEGRGGIAACVVRPVPSIGLSDILGGVGISKSHPYPEICHAERVEDGANQREATLQLLGHLVFGAEQVSIVLGESSDSGQAADLSRLFPAVHRAELGQSNR